jgi:UDP:flavonoid glycosyltransferase YjiC (YdhE family)
MARITIAWEIGAGRGHIGPLLPIAATLSARGHVVRVFLRETEGASGLAEAKDVEILPAPRWTGQVVAPAGRNVGEVLLNFGFHAAQALEQLVDAWRERLHGTDLLISNVAPAAVIAARTLGLPYLEASQGFHVPPPAFPTPPFRDWEPAPRRALEAADHQVLESINAVLSKHASPTIGTFGELFAAHLALLTYPELEMYPERGPSEYYGIMPGASRQMLAWPRGRPRILGYLQAAHRTVPALLDAIARRAGAAVVICPNAEGTPGARPPAEHVVMTNQLLDFPRMAEQADVVVCHASHQTTAEALLKGRPTLLLPTHTEQFLTMRRVVRMGAGLGIEPATRDPDLVGALDMLATASTYQLGAAAFAARYAVHSRGAALETLIGRCEAAVRREAPTR